MAKFIVNKGKPMERVVEADGYAEVGNLVNFFDEEANIVFTIGLQYFLTAERVPD